MSYWEETLASFRAFGGVADNVELREGSYGRGLFPKDTNQPVKILVPNNLLADTEWLQLDTQANLILSDKCDWSDEIKSFYLTYMHHYGLNEPLMQQLMQQQSQFAKLPEALKGMMKGFGFSTGFFQAPTRQLCLEIFKKSRRIVVNKKLVMMPLVELLNHEEQSKKLFHKDNKGISVSGRFKEEILVHYGMAGDAALMFEDYGFSTPKPYTFSGALAINVGSKVIRVARFMNLFTTVSNTNVPKLKLEGNEIHLSCLVLGSINDRKSPKKVFVKLMNEVGMPDHIASNVFDGIVEQNRSFFLHLLEELKPLEGTAVEGLRVMAKNQLIPLGVRV